MNNICFSGCGVRMGEIIGRTDDLAAEGEEIRKVIETLIQVLPKSEKKN